MTVAPTSFLDPSTGSGRASAEPSWLEGDLGRRMQRAATARGTTVAALCESWVREELERWEAHHAAEDADGSGRCSLRTGTCSLGPVPLPVQQ